MSGHDDIYQLPPDLPIPIGDGACDHLLGMIVPLVPLLSTAGRSVMLKEEPGTSVVFCYPRTGIPGEALPSGWDDIPGARGCTPEACGFRDHYSDLRALGATVFGLSTQSTDYQRAMAQRLRLPYEILSDENLSVTTALRLPTFQVEDVTLLKRFTLVLRNGIIRHVFYPIFPTDRHAEEVVGWLRSTASSVATGGLRAEQS